MKADPIQGWKKGLTRLQAAGVKPVGPECSELNSREHPAFLHLVEAEKNI